MCVHLCVCVYCISEGWSSWGNWGECSSECGGGVQTRTRVCQSPLEAYLCAGVLEEGRPCNPQPCIGEFCCICVFSMSVFPHLSFSFSFLSFFLSLSVSSVRCMIFFYQIFCVTDKKKTHIVKMDLVVSLRMLLLKYIM